jgi:hypothetical protein
MNAIPKIPSTAAKCPSPQENTEFALDLIRLCSRNLKLIDQQVTAIGTALGQRRMPPHIALKLVEQIAPGCIDVIYLSLFEGASPEQLHDGFCKEAPPSAQGNGVKRSGGQA